MRVLFFWLALALLPVVALLWQHEVALSDLGPGEERKPASRPEDLLVLEIGGRSPVLRIPAARDASQQVEGARGGHPDPGPVPRKPRAKPGAEDRPREDPVPDPRSEDRFVVVGEGETLYGIAVRELGAGTRWPEIARHNGIRPGQEGSVRPGTRLLIPARTRPGG